MAAAPTTYHEVHPDSRHHTSCGLVREGLAVGSRTHSTVTCAACLGDAVALHPVNRPGATAEGAFAPAAGALASNLAANGALARVRGTYTGRLSVDLTDALELAEQVAASLRRAHQAARVESPQLAASRLAHASAALAELTRVTLRATSSAETLARLGEEEG